MNDFDAEEQKVVAWLRPLSDEAAPCGVDLEYENEFLAITQAAAGKPESQFGPAEPPDWRAVVEMVDPLLDRSRDLRIAIFWLRATVHQQGYGMLPVGLKLINGLIETQWTHLHPLPDPDDGDPYARVNALTVLRESEGLIGDLRASHVVQDRAIGVLTARACELALGLSAARADETAVSKESLLQMLAAALVKSPLLRAQCEEAVTQVRRLTALLNDKLGSMAAPDLRPLLALVNGIESLLPRVAVADDGQADEADGGTGAAPGGGARRGLAGSVNSREEAIRAIDMVCEYLERTEPANVAPMFLRRGRQLINHNFLQLMKMLAPEALAGVAGLVGIDPEAIENPDGT